MARRPVDVSRTSSSFTLMPSGASPLVVVVDPPVTVVVVPPANVVVDPPAPVVVVSPSPPSGAVINGWNGSRGWATWTPGVSDPPPPGAAGEVPEGSGAEGRACSAPVNTPAEAISHTEAPAVPTSTRETKIERRVRLAPIILRSL